MRPVLASTVFAITLALTLALSPVAGAAPVPSQLDEKLERLMDDLEGQRLEYHVPGLAIAVVMDDSVVLARGLGLADVEGGRPASPRTVFAVGSTTKAFTSALAAISVERGEMAWDEPVSWYLPELDLQPDSEDPEAAVTFRDAMSHRSGFARMGALWAGGLATPEQVYHAASRAEPVAPFRESFNYNNIVYTGAGDAVGRAAGRRWEVLMRKRLLGPLGMTNATLSIQRAARDKNLATGYAWDEDSEEFRALPMRDIHLVSPAGAINATVLDMARWVRYQLARGEIDGKRLVSAEGLEETWSPQIGIAEGSSYGLGWMVHQRNGRRVVEHGGNIDGFAAQVTLYPDDGLGYVLLMNTTASPLQQTTLSLVAEALLGTEVEAGPGGLDLSIYPADYVANFGPFKDTAFAVSVVDEKLHVNVPGQMNFELKPPTEEGKWFFAMTDQIAVSFDSNEEGQVTGMKMYQSGMTFELPRAGFENEVAAGDLPAEWNELYGRYRSPSLKQDVTVKTQGGRLALDVPSQMVFELEPAQDGRWAFRVSANLEVAFDRDEKGEIVSMTQFRGGAPVETMQRVGEAREEDQAGDMAMVRKLVKADERGRALAALGGVAMKGTVRVHSSGLTGTMSLLSEGVDKFRHELDQSPFVTALTIVNADGISIESNVQQDTHLSAVQARQMRLGHPFSFFSDWDLFFDGASYAGVSEVDGRQAHVVKLEADDLEPHEVHIDAETGDVLQVRSVQVSGGGLPAVPMVSLFSDHRDVGGIRMPYKMVVSNDHTGSTTLVFDSVRTGLDFPAGTFATD